MKIVAVAGVAATGGLKSATVRAASAAASVNGAAGGGATVFAACDIPMSAKVCIAPADAADEDVGGDKSAGTASGGESLEGVTPERVTPESVTPEGGMPARVAAAWPKPGCKALNGGRSAIVPAIASGRGPDSAAFCAIAPTDSPGPRCTSSAWLARISRVCNRLSSGAWRLIRGRKRAALMVAVTGIGGADAAGALVASAANGFPQAEHRAAARAAASSG